jgi:hypothetical protein
MHGRAIAGAIFGCLLLSGCVTAEEQAKLDDSKCQSYGTKPGEPAYFQCRTQLETERNPTPPAAPVITSPAILDPHR